MMKTQNPGGKNGSKQDDLSGVHLWLVLWKASRAVEENARRSIALYGMVMSDFGVLEALLHRGPLSPKLLGGKVLLTSGSVTAAVDRLAARGLVRRVDDRADRRACIVHLTPAGRRLIERAFTQHRAEMETALEEFPLGERKTLLPLLRRLGRLAESRVRAAANEARQNKGLRKGAQQSAARKEGRSGQ